MPYDVYLHSSFDSQLQPLPGTIIDWQPTQSMVRNVRSASSLAPLLCGETRVTPWRVPLRYNTEPSSPTRSLGLSDRVTSSVTQCGSALLATSEAPRLMSQAVDHTPTLTSGAVPAASGGGTVTRGQDLAGRIAQDVAMVQAEAAVAGLSAATTLLGPSSARVEGRLAAGSVVDRAGNSNATGDTVSSLPAVIPVTRVSPTSVSDSTSTAIMTGNSNVSNKSSAAAVVKDAAAGTASTIGPTGSDVVGSTLHVNGRVAQAVQRDATMVAAAVAPSHLVISVPDAPGISRDASSAIVAGPSSAGEVTASPLVVSTSPSTTTTTTTATDRMTPLSTASRSPTLQLPCGRQEHGAEFIYGSYGEAQVYQKDSFICTAGLSALFGLSQVTRRYMRPVPEVQAEAMRLIQATESNSHTSVVTPHESSPKLLTSSDETQSQDKQLLLVGEVRQRCGLKVSEVAQLAWYWGRLHWSGVLNVRFLPWSGRQTASGAEGGKAARTPWLPVCEYVMRTPWTMWAVQRDASVTKVAGFLTLYQTTPRHTSNNVSSDSNSAVMATSSNKSATDKNDAEAGTLKGTKAHSAKAVVERSSTTKSGSDENSSAVGTSHEADKTATQGKTKNKKSAPPVAVAVQTPPAATSSSSAKVGQKAAKAVSEQSNCERHDDSVKAKHKAEAEKHLMDTTRKVSETHLTNQASSSDTLMPRVSMASLPWWRLRALRIGAGVAAKNDLARGINLYWGCSAEMGNGLCVATHIDVLRRLCCSFVSARGALTLAVRLRVNLITYSGTALDAGLMYVPCAALPHTTLRLTSSAAGQTIGLQVEDITHDWGAAWLARHRAWSSANASDSTSGSSKEVQVVQEERSAAVANEVEGRWFSLWTWWPTMPWSSSTTTTTSVGSASHSGHGKDNAIALHDKAGQTNTHAATVVEPDTTPGVLSVAHARALVQRWLPPVTTSRWWPQRAIDLTRRTQATATTQVRETWRLVRRLDWLERCLDKAHVDVTVGVAHDPVRHGTGWGTFLILTAH